MVFVCDDPYTHCLQKLLKTEAVDRMTDASKYTGTHRERFDSLGRGRGIEGRDFAPKGRGSVPTLASLQTGYVGGYRNEGTYHDASRPKRSRVRHCILKNFTRAFVLKSEWDFGCFGCYALGLWVFNRE